MSQSSLYFTSENVTANLTAPTSNTLISDAALVSDISYGVRLTTGNPNMLVVDISGQNVTDDKYFRIRLDIVDIDFASNNRSYTTVPFQHTDCSAVTGHLETDSRVHGEKLKTMLELPFHFRTLGADAMRVVVKEDFVISNGQKMNVYVDVSGGASTYNFTLGHADVSFNQLSTTKPYALINGGPSGNGTRAGIPGYAATVTKNPTDPTLGVLRIYSETPFFAAGGEGIKLAKAWFKISEYIQNGIGEEHFFELTPSVQENFDGLFYMYQITDQLPRANTNAFLLMCTRVADQFGVEADVQQTPIGNPLLAFQNKPRPVPVSSIDVCGGSYLGGQAHVSFSGDSAPDGFQTIVKYTAYYLNKGQALDISDNTLTQTAIKNYCKVKNQYKEILINDIDYSGYNARQNIYLSGLTNSDVSNNTTEYAVFITGTAEFVSSNGQVVLQEGDFADVSYSAIGLGDNNANLVVTDVSYLGFYVSGSPKVPVVVSVATGSDISGAASPTTNAEMSGMVQLQFNDYNIDMRGDQWRNLRYVIVQAQQFGAVEDTDFVNDASYSIYNYTGPKMTNAVDVVDIGALTHTWTSTSGWGSSNNSLQNGQSYYVKFALDNHNGVGGKTNWLPFKVQTMPNALLGLMTYDGKENFGYGDYKLENSEVALDASFAQNNMVITSDTIGFSANLKTLNQINTGRDASNALTGGSPITSASYRLERDDGVTVDARRLYGNVGRQIDNTLTIAQNAELNGSIVNVSVSEGVDPSGAAVGLHMGQPYKLRLYLANKNGYNDASNVKVESFVPMGPIKSVPTISSNAEPVMVSNTNTCSIDISFTDLSGVNQHGGHLITGYSFKIVQNQGAYGNVTIKDYPALIAESDISFSAGMVTSANGRQYTYTTLNTQPNVLPGYPLYVYVRAEAKVGTSTDGYGSAFESNAIYNKQGKSVVGDEKYIEYINGPRMAGSLHDEVNGLRVIPGDTQLVVQFAQPVNEGAYQHNSEEPMVVKYELSVYDMCLNTINSTSPQLAGLRAYAQFGPNENYANTILNNANGGYRYTFNNLPNGRPYLVGVKTHWKYGTNDLQSYTSVGIYHTDSLNGDETAIVVYKPSPDPYNIQWYPASDPNGQGTALSAQNANFLRDTSRQYAVCSGVPFLSANGESAGGVLNTVPNSVLFMDNGSTILDGIVVQVAPNNYATASDTSNSFIQTIDNTSDAGVTSATWFWDYIGDGVKRETLTQYWIIDSDRLGTNWQKEENIFIVANANGATWRKHGPV